MASFSSVTEASAAAEHPCPRGTSGLGWEGFSVINSLLSTWFIFWGEGGLQNMNQLLIITPVLTVVNSPPGGQHSILV